MKGAGNPHTLGWVVVWSDGEPLWYTWGATREDAWMGAFPYMSDAFQTKYWHKLKESIAAAKREHGIRLVRCWRCYEIEEGKK